ncbi:amidase [Brachybacterium horti]
MSVTSEARGPQQARIIRQWAETVRAVGEGILSCEQVTMDAVDAARSSASTVNAFCDIDAEGAIEAARAADARRERGLARSDADGLPVGVKDNLFVAGRPATWGSELWRSHIPAEDDIPVERVRQAGAVVLGKTNTAELAMGFVTDNRVGGLTRNPRDLRLSPGGSSGGSAAAVAAGIVPLAISTDGGGSSRVPAAFTGLYGLKPSTGAIARGAGFPALAADFQVVGAIAGDLEFLQLAFGILRGHDRRDPSSSLVPAAASPATIRFGWCAEEPGVTTDPVAAQRVGEVVAALDAENGFELVGSRRVADARRVHGTWWALASVGVHAVVARRRAGGGSGDLTEHVQAIEQAGARVSATQQFEAWEELGRIRSDAARAWGDLDLLITPTTPQLAPAADAVSAGELPGAYATWVNATGQPAMSVPVAAHPDGRQIGVQLVAGRGQDDLLFRVARRLRGLGIAMR